MSRLKATYAAALAHTGDECFSWPHGRIGNGYCRMSVDGKLEYVHRLVCKAVHGPPPTPKHQAAHSCGKGHLGCVSPKHLSWKTGSENMQDIGRHGTGATRLTPEQSRTILKLKGQATQKEIAAQFGVHRSTVGYIHAGHTWQWLSGAN